MWRVVMIAVLGPTLVAQHSNPEFAAFMARHIQNTRTAVVQDDAQYFKDAGNHAAQFAIALVERLSEQEFSDLSGLLENESDSGDAPTPSDPSQQANFTPKLTPAQLGELAGVVDYKGGTDFSTAFTGMAGPAQHAFLAMALEYHQKTGKRLQVDSAYRSAAYQTGVRQQYGKEAASPGWSQHQHGYSIDIDREGRRSPQVEELHRMGLLVRHGFVKDNPSGEAWHIEHQASYSRFSKDMLAYCAKLSLRGMDGFSIHRHIAMTGMFNDAPVIGRVEGIGKKNGLPAGYMATMLNIESAMGRNMLNASGASGWYQLMPTMARAYGVKNTMDLGASANAAAQLAVDNRAGMAGVMPVTGASLYIAHQQGLPVALAIWRLANGAPPGMAEGSVINSIGYNLPASVRGQYLDVRTVQARDGRVRPLYTLKGGVSAAQASRVFLGYWQAKYSHFEATMVRLYTGHDRNQV